MAPGDDRSGDPWWVREAWSGHRTRKQVRNSFKYRLALFPLLVIFGVRVWVVPGLEPAGVLFWVSAALCLVSAFKFWVVCRWLDRHGRWPEPGKGR